MPEEPTYNEAKFDQVVHLVCSLTEPHELGKTKLNKVMYYADRLHYYETGFAITGEAYVKRQFGPVPSHIDEALDRLKAAGSIAVRKGRAGSYDRIEFMATADASLEGLTAKEVDVIHRMVSWIAHNHTATSISERSHDRIWELADYNDPIPYETVFAARLDEVTPADFAWLDSQMGLADA